MARSSHLAGEVLAAITCNEYYYEVVKLGALYLENSTMAESVSYIHPTGALICVSAVCLAFIVSYLALKSRGRVSRRGVNGAGPTSVPLCKVCHQLLKNTPSQNHLTKEWTCSACSGYSRSTEVRNYVENVLTLSISLDSLFLGNSDACFGTISWGQPLHKRLVLEGNL